MSYIADSIIQNIVDVIINTRDFCGNEWEAATDEAYASGLVGSDIPKAVKIANFRANKVWNSHKKAAGVNPKYIF